MCVAIFGVVAGDSETLGSTPGLRALSSAAAPQHSRKTCSVWALRNSLFENELSKAPILDLSCGAAEANGCLLSTLGIPDSLCQW